MQALVAVYLIGKLTGKLFFGSLRPAESEVLILLILHFLIINLKYLCFNCFIDVYIFLAFNRKGLVRCDRNLFSIYHF